MPSRRLLLIVAAVAGLLALGVGLRALALQHLRAAVMDSLGPQAEVGEISLGINGVELRDLRVPRASPRWPAADELRAKRVRVQPELGSLLFSDWRVRSITIEGAYLALLRPRKGGLQVVPTLLRQRDEHVAEHAGAPRPARRMLLRELVLRDATVEFYDASVRNPPHRIVLDGLQATLGPMVLPALDAPMDVDLQALLKGPARDGRLALRGALTPASHDAQLAATLQGADLVALQPYLLKLNDGGVRRGTLDLTLDARVQADQLHAPGTLVLTGLELADDGHSFGVPRSALLGAMKRDGRIELHFTLEGRLDDPKFSLNESIALKFTAGLAEALGVSLGGVVEGVGNVIKGLFGR